GRKQLSGRVGMIIANAAAQVIMPSVAEDVALSLRHLPKDELDPKLQAVLAEHHLEELADRPALSLSSGQLQRLALASVLATSPEVLIADEPTTMLDARYAKLVAEQLFCGPHRELVLITHDLNLASPCDDILWIHDAEIAHRGPAAIDPYLEPVGYCRRYIILPAPSCLHLAEVSPVGLRLSRAVLPAGLVLIGAGDPGPAAGLHPRRSTVAHHRHRSVSHVLVVGVSAHYPADLQRTSGSHHRHRTAG